MVRIRLSRMGRKNRPFFRIGVYHSQNRRDGKCIERLGTYDPLSQDVGRKVNVDRERLAYWISRGAQPTEKVACLLKHAGAL